MSYGFSYFRACMKKAFKKYVSVFVITALLVAALFLVAQMIINMNESDASRQKVRIGIVGDLSDTYMGISIPALESIDDLGLTVDFVEMDEAEADRALVDSEISAYVYVPENYISDLARGKDVRMSFVMAKSTAASGVLMRELVGIISPLVTEAESGIRSMKAHHRSIKAPDIKKRTVELNLKYIDMVLNRSDFVNLKTVGVDSLTLTEYYICGIIIFFFLMFALSCCMIFSDRQLALGRLFCSKNVRPWRIVLSEYGAYAVVMWITAFLVCAAASLLPFETPVSDGGILSLLSVLTPCILMISAMHFLIYEATGGIVTGVLAQFITAVFMGYISGCFYPYYFFPEIIQKISSVLPSGIMFRILRDYILGITDMAAVSGCIGYAAAFLILSSAIRKFRLRRDTL